MSMEHSQPNSFDIFDIFRFLYVAKQKQKQNGLLQPDSESKGIAREYGLVQAAYGLVSHFKPNNETNSVFTIYEIWGFKCIQMFLLLHLNFDTNVTQWTIKMIELIKCRFSVCFSVAKKSYITKKMSCLINDVFVKSSVFLLIIASFISAFSAEEKTVCCLSKHIYSFDM